MLTVQMSVWVPVIAALAGGLIASIAPIVVGVIQSRAEHDRELLRLATELAIEEDKAALAKVQLMKGPASISPIALNLAYHMGLLKLLAKREPISPADMVELQVQTNKLFSK